MRAPQLRLSLEDEIVVDQFAGGGGASLGIEMAIGRSPNIAINHDPEAIAVHAANHPETTHYCEDVFHVNPYKVCGGKPVGLMWLSPDCKDFSKAKGGVPVDKKIRSLAWVAIKWARSVQPRIIILENVEEFQRWGPLTPEGLPCKARRGQTFQRFIQEFYKCGYHVEYRELRACDFGAPTIRKRLFLIARRDGEQIVWPDPTHGPDGSGLLRYRTAADCIDFSIPCPSIFERSRALADNTLRRVANGIFKFVIKAARPFLVPLTHTGDARVYSADEPMRTLTTAHRGEQALVAANLMVNTSGHSGASLAEPAPTQATGNHEYLVAANLVDAAHGEVSPTGVKRWGNGSHEIDKPLGTIAASGNQAVVETQMLAASLVQTGYGERAGQHPRSLDITKPLGTVVAGGQKHALCTAHIQRDFGQSIGHPADDPIGTITSAGQGKAAVVSAFLAQHNGGFAEENAGRAADQPLSTIVHRGTQQQVVTSNLVKLYGTCKDGQSVDRPIPTVTATGTHIAEVRALLEQYQPGGCSMTDDEYVIVTIDGIDYIITDIGMRMLQPRELFRAQGFPDSYKIEIDGLTWNRIIAMLRFGRPLKEITKSIQVRLCGNSVCPDVAAAVVRANFRHRIGSMESIPTSLQLSRAYARPDCVRV